MRLAPLACAVVGVLAIAACGATGPARGEREIALTGAELDLLTRSGSFTRTSTVLANKEAELTATCMTEKGFTYRAEFSAPPTGSHERQTLNMRDRRTRGYGLGAQRGSGADGRSSASNDAYVAALPERKADAYMKALRGDDSDFREMRFGGGQNVTFSARGCEAESREALYGELDEWIAVTYFPQNLNSGLTPRVEKAPKYLKAMGEWKTCMRAKGHPYASPDDAYERLKAAYREQGAPRELRKREIAVAVADGECAAELHIPSLVLALRRTYAQSLPEADKLRLRHLTTVWRVAVDRAR